MDENFFSILIVLLESLLFYYMPTFNGKNTLFGLVLKEDDFQSVGIPILRSYRRNLIIILGMFISAVFLSVRYAPESMVFAYILATLGQVALIFIYFPKAWRVRDQKPLTKFATILKVRKLSDFTKIGVEVAVILLAIAPFAILAVYYSRLPDIVPIHWNWKGEADGWQKKGFFSVFLLPVLILFLQTFFFVLKKDIIRARFVIPAENAETVAGLKETSLKININLLDWCRLLVGVQLASLSLQILASINSFAFSKELIILLWTSLILLLGGIGFHVYQLVLINREIKNLTGQINFQIRAETGNWNGGIFYYNPNDAAFVVEKPTGLGYTLNFAHKKIWLYAAIFIVPVILFVADFALMERL